MDKPDQPEWLTAAECASRTGLTVRALRVYEEYGLIAPRRSAGGWRQYGPDDLVKLNTIAMLKTAGLSLSQIRDVTRSSPRAPTLQQILEIQLGTWNTRLEDAERGRAITKAALERLSTDHSLSIDELCNVIRSFEMSQIPPAVTPADKEIEEVILEPAVLDRYVGFYAPHNGEFGYYTITRDGEKLTMQITGQPPFDLYPVGETEFAVKVVDAQITFVRDADGHAATLVLRQMGVEIRGVRIDAATAEQSRARLAARIESKTPTPGSEEALRRLVEGIRAGAPDYEAMSPGFAQVLRRQLPRLQPIASYLGEIRSIEFQGVGSQGWDVYEVNRERGSGRWRIALGSDGKVLGALAVLTSPPTLGP
jgi:DNA-binding transcriptional MerR regulator